jgi:hypothetical protein
LIDPCVANDERCLGCACSRRWGGGLWAAACWPLAPAPCRCQRPCAVIASLAARGSHRRAQGAGGRARPSVSRRRKYAAPGNRARGCQLSKTRARAGCVQMSDLQTETKNDAEKTAAAAGEPPKENMMTKVRMRVVHTKLCCQRLVAECGRRRGGCGKFGGLLQRRSVLEGEGSDPEPGQQSGNAQGITDSLLLADLSHLGTERRGGQRDDTVISCCAESRTLHRPSADSQDRE